MRRALMMSLVTLLLTVLPLRALAGAASETVDTAVQDRADNFWFGHRGRTSDVVRSITVMMQGSRFLPGTIDVKRGETIRFVIINRDSIAHEFVLGDAAEQAAHEKEMASMPGMLMTDPNGVTVAPGKTGVFIWMFTQTAQLQYACHLPGHYQDGMFGRLNIHD